MYDQYKSRLKDCQFTARCQYLSTHKYRGGTLFYDAARSKVTFIHQVGLTATETVQEKLQFEREDAAVGVLIKQYCTENVVYTPKEFVNIIISKG